MFLRLAEEGIHEGNSRFSLERNLVPDLRLGPASSQPPGFSWPGLAWIQRVMEARGKCVCLVKGEPNARLQKRSPES